MTSILRARLFRRVIFSIGILVLGIGAVDSQMDSTAPYIYYYSSAQSAFVIERADGSDSRVLVDYVFSCPQCIPVGPGWSPSGEWFAWMNRRSNGSSIDANVVNQRGGEIVRFHQLEQITALDWSPTSDFLLVSGYETYGSGSPSEKVFLYDANRQVTLLLIEGTDISDDEEGQFFYQVGWTPTGDVFVTYGRSMQIIPVSSDRDVRTIELATSTPWACLRNRLPFWTESDVVNYISSDNHKLVIENLSSGQIDSARLPPGDLSYIAWSNDNRYALVYMLHTTRPYYRLWLFSRSDLTFEALEDTALFPSCRTDSLWSADNRGIFAASEGGLYMVEPVSRTISKVAERINVKIDELLPLQWSLDRNEVAFAVLRGRQVFSYNFLTQQLTLMVDNLSEDHETSYFGLPREGYWVYVWGGDGYIRNLSTGIETQVTLGNTEYGPADGIVEELLWHDSADWLFALGWFGPSERVAFIVNSDGTRLRELGVCPYPFGASCFGWLPIADV
jgi:hypothetical protein